MKLFELFADLILNAKGFESGVKNAGKQGKNLASTLKNNVGGAATFVGEKVSATTIAMGHLMADATKAGLSLAKQLGAIGLDYNAQMETYVTNFRTMLGGSAEEAEKLTGDLEDMAASTPFAMTDLADATQTLLAFGQDSSTVLDTLQSLGDIAMGDSNKLQSLTLAFAQASSSGKLMGQDLMQMVNAGFNPLQTIVDKTGASMGELKDFMSTGKATGDLRKSMREAQKEVRKLGDNASEGAKMLVQMQKDGAISAELLGEIFEIETSPGGKFYEAMLNASKTYEGMVSTLQDDSTALLGKVFKPVSEFMTEDLLPKAIGLIGAMDKAYDEAGLSAAVKAATDTIGGYFAQWAPMALDAGAGILTSLYNGLTGDSATKEEVTAFLSGLWTDAQTAVDAFLGYAGGVLNSIFTALTGDTDSTTGIDEKLATLWDTGKDAATAFSTAAGGLLADIYKGFTGGESTPENISATLEGLFTGGQGKLDQFLKDGKDLLSGIYEGMTGNDALDEIGMLLGGLFSEGLGAIDGLKSTAGQLLGTIYTTLTGQKATADNIGKTIGGVFSAGADAANDLLITANTFFEDLNRELGNPDASIGKKIAGVFEAGGEAMIHLLNDAGSFMSKLYTAITGDTEGAAKIQGWVDSLFRTPEKVEAANAAAGARTDTNSTFEIMRLRAGNDANAVNDMFVSLVNDGYQGFSSNFQDEWLNLYTKAVMSGTTEDERYQDFASQIVEAWNAINQESEQPYQDDDATLQHVMSAVASLEEAANGLADRAASAAIAALSGAKVQMDGQDVGELVLPTVAAGIMREVLAAMGK